MLIQISELCTHNTLTIPQDHEWNLMRLFWVMNLFRRAYGKPMTVDSGYRTMEEHEEIYRKRNEQRIIAGLQPIPVPMESCHLIGAACDIADSDGAIRAFILSHMDLAERLDLYFEAFDATPGWVHFQIYPPQSGKRFFEP